MPFFTSVCERRLQIGVAGMDYSKGYRENSVQN